MSKEIPVIFNETYHLLHYARAAVVTSGTATLETALFGTPQIAGYRTIAWQYIFGKYLIKVPYISLVNLILNRPAIPELIQKDFEIDKIISLLPNILEGEKRKKMLKDYKELKDILGNKKPSVEVPQQIINFLTDL